jgi:RNA polymerase sigma-70 factor (ECF subfamily)
LLRRYDANRAALSTWLTIVTRSAAHDAVRRRRMKTQPIEETAEEALAVEPRIRDAVAIPDALLSPRQALVLSLLYDREMDVSEVALALGVEAQTVRTTHHKALLKLRAHFKRDVQLFWG